MLLLRPFRVKLYLNQRPPIEILISILFESQQAGIERGVELAWISPAGFLSQIRVSSMGKCLVQGLVVFLCEDISELPFLKVDCDGNKFKLSGILIKIHIRSANVAASAGAFWRSAGCHCYVFAFLFIFNPLPDQMSPLRDQNLMINPTRTATAATAKAIKTPI
jgi:hypothetical protein